MHIVLAPPGVTNGSYMTLVSAQITSTISCFLFTFILLYAIPSNRSLFLLLLSNKS